VYNHHIKGQAMKEIVKRRLSYLKEQINNSEGLIKQLLIKQYNELVLDWSNIQRA
jgi:hypothetical protein